MKHSKRLKLTEQQMIGSELKNVEVINYNGVKVAVTSVHNQTVSLTVEVLEEMLKAARKVQAGS